MSGPPPHAILLDKFNQMLAMRSVAAIGSMGIADVLANGPASASTLAAGLQLNPQALFRLLRAGANVGVVTQTSPDIGSANFALTTMGECLRSNVPGSLRYILEIWSLPGHWQAFGQFEEAIRSGKPAFHAAHGSGVWEYFKSHPSEENTFSKAMTGLSGSVLPPILALYPFEKSSIIADIGGSQGMFLASVLVKAPISTGILFDIPAVIANVQLNQYEANQRMTAVSGDFFNSVPQADLYMLKHILHDWNDEECVLILKSIAHTASKGAKVLIIEMVLHADVEPSASVGGLLSPSIFMDINMMMVTTGVERTAKQYAQLLAETGLEFTQFIPTASPYGLVEGRVQ